jgi:hypothetical protein
MAACVFCGKTVLKSERSKEHILPIWLLKATGDPHRNIRIEFDPDSGADRGNRSATRRKDIWRNPPN